MRSLSIGRIQDIDIRLHWSFALVFAWVLFDWRDLGLSDGLGQSAVALVLVALVFGCVLLHEMGHAFMAREYGIRVRDVTLSVIGGVARMEDLPTAPRAEAAIALAGPATNVAIAAALLPIVLLIGVTHGFASFGDYVLEAFSPSFGGLAIGLFYANVLIVLFNLLPAFPMDGGRMLRAGLTTVVGRESGTRIAVLVGQGLAVALAIVSVVWLHSLTLPLIALFIAGLAQAEGRAVRIESAMRRMRVGQFALWDMGGVAPEQPLAVALRGGPRDVAVTREGKVVGMLWRNTLLAELSRGGKELTVADAMAKALVVADVDESVYDVHQRMNACKAWAAPVTEDDIYRGIFTADRFLHVYRQLAPNPLELAFTEGPRAALQRWLGLFNR
ncbi:MAG TPA: site-2 protease family protein [Thermomicrobiales bacterium]|nr:site-2 protease family protein [Thermomicrobiales bacterium]